MSITLVKDEGSLSTRSKVKKGGARRQSENGGFDADLIKSIFSGINQTAPSKGRPMVRRGMSGAVLNADGSDPAGSGLDQFFAKNPHLATRDQRQNEIARENQQRYRTIFDQGRAAVDARKQQQSFPNDSLFNPIGGGSSSVKSPDGYTTVFNPQGVPVGTNAPIGRAEKFDESSLPEQWRDSSPVGSTNAKNPFLGQQISNAAFAAQSGPRRPALGSVGASQMSAPKSDPMLSNVFGSPQVVASQLLENPFKSLGQGVVPQQAAPQQAESGSLFGAARQSRPQSTGLKPSKSIGVPPPSDIAQREMAKRSAMGVGTVQRADQGPEYQPPVVYVPPGALAQPGVISKVAPYGVNQSLMGNNAVPRVRGFFPNVQQTFGQIGAMGQDLWSSLFGEPQTAMDQFRQEQLARAIAQYRMLGNQP